MTLTVKKIPDDLKFIGIHAHALEIGSEIGENIFPFEVIGVVEEPLNFVVTLRAAKEALPLRWQADKNLRITNEEIFLSLPADKIIFLRG